MLKINRMVSLLLFFSCLVLKCFGSEDNTREINDQVIEQLFAAHDTCVIAIENECEVYLDPSKIIAHENGLFLETQSGECLRIPFLLSNERGCFTMLCANLKNDNVYPIIKCWNCGKAFNPNIFNKGKCPQCAAQN